MGGSIPIAARFNDGETICVDGWTNFMPTMIVNLPTFSGDDSVVKKTLLEVANHKSYDGPQPFRSYGYGMVAIDFAKREIHSKQNYCSYNRRLLLQLSDINRTGWQGRPFLGGKYVVVLTDEATALLDAGRISITSRNGEECKPEVLTKEKTIEILHGDTMAMLDGKDREHLGITIDTGPFTVHDYPDEGSLTAMKERLKAAGFPMTKADGLNAMFSKAKAK